MTTDLFDPFLPTVFALRKSGYDPCKTKALLLINSDVLAKILVVFSVSRMHFKVHFRGSMTFKAI